MPSLLKSVLLVDDDPVSNLICEKLLKRSELAEQIKSFGRAEDALKYLEHVLGQEPTQMPDYIFLDLNMPILNGWQFIERFQAMPLSKNPKKTAIYVLTSSIDRSDRLEAEKKTSVEGFIVKPFTEEKLMRIFKTIS